MSTSGESSNGSRRFKKPLTRSSEAILRWQIVKAIKQRWPWAWVYHPCDTTHSGIPDLLCCINGQFLALEVKTPTGRVAPIQDAILSQIRLAKGRAWVIRSVKELTDVAF